MIKRLAYIISVSAIATLLLIIIFNIYPRYSTSFETTKIDLKTIVCEDCVENIKSALRTDAGIIKSSVSLKNKSAVVEFDEKKTGLEKIEALIVAAGYDANENIADSTAYRKLNTCCKVWGDGDNYMDIRGKKTQGCKGGCCSN